MIKPVLDWIIAIFALIILSPVFIIIAISIKIDSKGPVFFCQKRLGLNGEVFKIVKFRSLFNNSKNIVDKNPLFEKDIRITKVGGFLRKTSLDEIPQIFNILKGEMSFIGPRPPVEYYPRKYNEYPPFEKKRFSVKPGLSGLVQVRNRENNEWDHNIPIDIEYVENQSFLFDLKIFLISLFVFFKTDNIYTKK